MRGCEKILPLDDWQRLKTQIFWCYEGQPPLVAGITHYRTPNHSAWLILSGEATVHWNGRPRTVRPGEWVIVPPPGYERSFTEDVEMLSVHFRLSWAEDSDLFTLSAPAVFPAERHPALLRVTWRLRRFFERFPPHNRFVQASRPMTLPQYLQFQTLAGRFALTLANVLDDEQLLPEACCARPNPQAGHILARLRDLPLDQPWNTAATARSLGMSGGHFNRVFRQEYGQTPRQYFDTRRLEHAKRGVIAGQGSLKEVAAAVGFSSAVFCRWFRQAVGASPTRYRHMLGLTGSPELSLTER